MAVVPIDGARRSCTMALAEGPGEVFLSLTLRRHALCLADDGSSVVRCQLPGGGSDEDPNDWPAGRRSA